MSPTGVLIDLHEGAGEDNVGEFVGLGVAEGPHQVSRSVRFHPLATAEVVVEAQLWYEDRVDGLAPLQNHPIGGKPSPRRQFRPLGDRHSRRPPGRRSDPRRSRCVTEVECPRGARIWSPCCTTGGSVPARRQGSRTEPARGFRPARACTRLGRRVLSHRGLAGGLSGVIAPSCHRAMVQGVGQDRGIAGERVRRRSRWDGHG